MIKNGDATKIEFTEPETLLIQRLSDVILFNLANNPPSIVITALALTSATFFATCDLAEGLGEEKRLEAVDLYVKQIKEMIPVLVAADKQDRMLDTASVVGQANNTGLA